MARAILVCNNENERLLLRACLEGYTVADVQTLKDAVIAFRPARPDLVLVRVGPEDPAGLQLLQAMKRAQIRVPTIVVLPRQPGALIDEVLRLGVTLFVLCPVRYRDIRRVIQEVRRDPQQAIDEDVPSIAVASGAGTALATKEP